jgi:uncharacterized protein YggE
MGSRLKTVMPGDHAVEYPRRQALVKFLVRWQLWRMRLFSAPAVFCGILAGGAALAASPTVLTLSATGSVTVPPDQMVASLEAQGAAPSAAQAQDEVNRMMASALGQARATAGVTAVTADYTVSETDPQNSGPPSYQASQTLNLTIAAPGGAPPAPFTALVGKLQQQGLLLDTLDGQLSEAGADAARRAATIAALHRLKADAGAIAAALGDKVGDIQTLSIDAGNPGPVAPRMMMMAAAAPPQAAPGPVTIQVTAGATITLVP